MKNAGFIGKIGFVKTKVALVLCSLFFLLAWAGCSQESFQNIPNHVSDFRGILVKDNLPAKKKSAKDSVTRYSLHKGKATLIVLTASWCPACQAEVPLLKEIHKDYQSQGLKILLISEDDSPAIASRYKKKAELPWTMMHWNYDIMNALGNPGVIPVSYLVNQQDSIVNVEVGIFDDGAMRRQIEKLLK